MAAAGGSDGPAFADPFTTSFRDPELMDKLAAIPEVRAHMADPGFLEQMERLRKIATSPAAMSTDPHAAAEASQAIARAGHNDPRVMQALLALSGQGLIVDEKDLKKAESVGDMKRREPVQLEHLQLVHDLTDADVARTKGNEYFKAGDVKSALAHYERGVGLLREAEEVDAAAFATLLSNAAMCLLKLEWPDRAKKSASQAIAVLRQVDDQTFDQSKLFHRRALACEQLKEFDLATNDMARAFGLAKKAGRGLREQHDLKNEVERLKKLRTSHEAHVEKKVQEKANEKSAEVTRLQGAELEKSQKAQPKAGTAPIVSQDYLQESDYTHFVRKRLGEVVLGIKRKTSKGGELEVTGLKEESKIEAAITTKRGKRALFYEMDISCDWSYKGKDGNMTGLIRVYNIAHDTKFQLGGDENTSYIYQLAWDQRKTGDWKEDLRVETAELFDLVSKQVDEVLGQLRKK